MSDRLWVALISATLLGFILGYALAYERCVRALRRRGQPKAWLD